MIKAEWKWGYISREGEMVIAPRFDDAWPFHEGLAAVKVDWARGYIDSSGEYVIAPRFEKAGPFRNGVARVVEDGEIRYIDRAGGYVAAPLDPPPAAETPLPPDPRLLETFNDAGGFSEGLAPVRKSAAGKWGYADEEGRIVVKPQFRQAGDFSEGLAPVLVKF